MINIKKILYSLLIFIISVISGCNDDNKANSNNSKIKIGFIVKQAEEPWFQEEWRFAEQAAQENGFEIIKIGAPSGDKVLSSLDNLAAQKAQGVIICAPDVKLGQGIAAKATQNNLKLMSVDDQLVDGSDNPIESIPHMGISATKIGEQAGKAITEEINNRGWNYDEVGAIVITYDQLPTAKERTEGAKNALTKAGFPEANFINSPQSKTDTEAAFNASNVTLTKYSNKFKHWISFGLNDEAVLGAVRAAEGKGINAENFIGVGIGGSQSALNEFNKDILTGFYGTVLISPRRHGYETAMNMYYWIKDGTMPELNIKTEGKFMNRDKIEAVKKEMGL